MHSGIQSWKNLVRFTYNFFSIPLLLRTLFNPFQNDKPNKDFDLFEIIVFAIFSRVLGLLFRLILIVIGLALTILVILTFPIFLFVPAKISIETLRGLGSVGSPLSYGNTFYLNKYGHDVSTFGQIRLFGKDKALRMIERSLEKDTIRNVLLVGETGVGKSLVISHLGRLGRSGLSFHGIAHHRVVNFRPDDISVEDFDHAMREASSAGNVILAIENIHVYENIFERLLPYLDKVHLGIIATTDFENYDAVLKRYEEFLSKFEKIDLGPATLEETDLILRNYIRLKRVQIQEDAIAEILRLSERYVGHSPQPLKSLLIIEELMSLKKMITIEDVRQIVSDKTNMPIGDMESDEKEVLLSLENTMREKIIGQDEAVEDVSQALKRLRTGVADPNKPASFLFLGPTGVGKTYTAKILAESYFGRKDAMIRFDMSEFSMPGSVSTFSDRLGAIIEEVPLSLVFLDELEKANKTIHQLLLQILDEGHLTRASGREVSFKNAIVIATTNAGSQSLLKNPNIDKKVLINELIDSGSFAPEFLNRWSDIILFKSLGKDGVRKVAELLLHELKDRIFDDKALVLEVTDALIDKIAEAGFDPEFGARPIHRAIEDIVENKIADYMISGETGKNIKIL